MAKNIDYWKALVSNALRKFRELHNIDAVNVIKNADFKVELNNYAGWNSEIEYWDLIFELNYKDFVSVQEKKDHIEGTLLEILESFHSDEYNPISNVIIRVKVEHFLDWQSILPDTKESTISLIEFEKKILQEVATGRSYKEAGLEESFQKSHQRIMIIAKKVGFDYPVNCNSLAEWWVDIKRVEGYTGRRAYISKLFAPLMERLRSSDECCSVDFRSISSKSGTVKKAVDDAELFIREGSFDSAFDRVHTAFHGYLETILQEHGVKIGENESMTALFNKLHGYYGGAICPEEVGKRVKIILRGAGGIINAINELRNNNTIAHPNSQLIQEREAKLVIRLVNAIVDYIEDIENTIITS